MNLSGPAMSRTLGRIREAFGDPILVAAGRKMVPTPHALELQARIHEIVGTASELFRPENPIDLAAMEPQFTIRTNDLFIGAFGMALLGRLQTKAPRCRLRFAPDGDDDLDMLREGRIDLYIGATIALRPEIRTQALFDLTFQVLARAGHPIFETTITPQSLVAHGHIVVSRRSQWIGPIDRVLGEMGLSRTIALVVPTYYSMIETLRFSDMIMPVPDIVARNLPLETIGLKVFDLPFPIEPVTLFQAWHPRHDRDFVHRWLRQEVLATARNARPIGEG
ncbi:transcriptional regulator, LysR family [Beijerinckia indica subsp. indica ATCC 9039]|uniref:Transcriptional regulator, LysR family n=2 Tax=Beijerinckia TaxID=532 RepID=B2IIF3_BEII9|nr:transcriptional regulator, LysR family [Beijerinckia indica subsp. indica ATCC 9039]